MVTVKLLSGRQQWQEALKHRSGLEVPWGTQSHGAKRMRRTDRPRHKDISDETWKEEQVLPG